MKKRKLSKKNIRRLFCALAAFILLTGAAAYTVFMKPGQNQERYVYKEENVKRGDVVQGVMESGAISLKESSVSYNIDVNTDEDSDEDDDSEEEEDIRYLQIGEVFVVSGQRIGEGDPLFSITEKSRRAVIRKLQAAVTEKEIALSQAQAEYRSQLPEAKGAYDQSRLYAETAGTIYEGTVTQAREEINGLQEEIAVLELEVNQCLEKLTDEDFLDSLNQAQEEYEKAKKKYEETDAHSIAAYTANYAAYQTAAEQYESLLTQKEGWEETISGNEEKINQNNEDILEKQALFSEKELDAENTLELNRSTGGLAPEIYAYTAQELLNSVDSAKEDCEEAAEKLERLMAFVGEDGIIYADGGGLVTAVNYEAGDKLTKTGSMLDYVKEDAYTVSIDVSEEDVAKIAIGDNVQIVFDAYPKEDYTGTVSAVTTTRTSEHAKTVSYPVEITINGSTEKLFGGMTAEITFVTAKVSDVLYVSKKAVETVDGVSYVYTGDGEEKQRKKVTTGFSNSTQVEITEGLSEGDVVYMKSAATEGIE